MWHLHILLVYRQITTDTEVTFAPKIFNSGCKCLRGVEILRKVFEAKTDEPNIKKERRKLRKHLHLYSSLVLWLPEKQGTRCMHAYVVVTCRPVPIFSRTIGSQMAVRLSALSAGRPLSLGIFLVLISVRGWVDTRTTVRLEGLGRLKKKSDDLIGKRTRDLPACSIVPQPTTLPRAHKVVPVLI
jgi:hypothetical protein